MIFESKRKFKSRDKAGPRYARLNGGRKKTKARGEAKGAAFWRILVPDFKSVKLTTVGRGLKLMLTACLSLAAVLAISGVLVAAYLYVSKSDYFAVKKVLISGLNHLQRQQIIQSAGLDEPANILTFDVEKISREISALPWVARVSVSRQMPDTISIQITEHDPKFLVKLGEDGRMHYINDLGEPFKELAPGENPNLPIVNGFSPDDLLSPGPVVKNALREVFHLAEVLRQRNDEFKIDNISEIHYDMVRGLTVVTKVSGIEVKVGFGAYEEKFRRLGRVMAHLKISGKLEGLVYLNLEAGPRVTVRYADSGFAGGQNT